MNDLQVVRFHDLRHIAATMLFAQNVHPKVVSEMLGQATISLALDTYSHLVPPCTPRRQRLWTRCLVPKAWSDVVREYVLG